MSVLVGPSQNSPTETLKANPVSGLHYVVKGITFRALTEFQLLEGLKCIESVDTEGQELQRFDCFLLSWQDTVRASWSLVLKESRSSCLKGDLCLGSLVHHGLSCGDQLIKIIIIWGSKGTFMRNRYFSSPSSICSGSISCSKRAAELCSSSSWNLGVCEAMWLLSVGPLFPC